VAGECCDYNGGLGQRGGIPPNPADYALLELKDQRINGQRHRIGEVTGFLGFQTLSLFPNHVHVMGYPSQLDAGKKYFK
jgi:hypothetical protein